MHACIVPRTQLVTAVPLEPLRHRMSVALCDVTCAHALRPPALHDRRVDAVHLGQDFNGAKHLHRIDLRDVELPHQLDKAQARFKRQRRRTARSSKQCQMYQLAIKFGEAGLQQSRHQRRDVCFYKADPLRIGPRKKSSRRRYSQEGRGYLRGARRAPGLTNAASTSVGHVAGTTTLRLPASPRHISGRAARARPAGRPG